MALPNKIQLNAITGASSPATIDNDINGLKQAIQDIFAIPDNTNISAAVMTVNASGLDNVIFRNTAANPDASGELQRNGTAMKYHNGSAVRTLMTLEDNQTVTGGFTYTSNAINITAGASAVIGTTDSQDMAIKANGSSRILIKSAGQILIDHSTATGANAGDIVLDNNNGLRFLNQALSTSANYGVFGNSSDHLDLAVPATSNSLRLLWGGTPLLQFNGGSGANIQFLAEAGDPAAPAANHAVLYTRDNGSGATNLCVRFNTGNVQVLGEEGTEQRGWVLLVTRSASASATIDFTTNINSVYDSYVIKIVDLIPATNGTNLLMRVSQSAVFNSGSSYGHARFGWDHTPTSGGAGSNSDTSMVVTTGLSNGSGHSFQGTVEFSNPSGSAKGKYFRWQVNYTTNTPSIQGMVGTGVFSANNNPIDGVRFLMSSGNITSGLFFLYGIRKF